MTAADHSRNTRVSGLRVGPSSFTSHMRKPRRYSITIKDAEGSIVFATAAVWDGDDRRAAVAKILRLDGVIEAPCFPVTAKT